MSTELPSVINAPQRKMVIGASRRSSAKPLDSGNNVSPTTPPRQHHPRWQPSQVSHSGGLMTVCWRGDRKHGGPRSAATSFLASSNCSKNGTKKTRQTRPAPINLPRDQPFGSLRPISIGHPRRYHHHFLLYALAGTAHFTPNR